MMDTVTQSPPPAQTRPSSAQAQTRPIPTCHKRLPPTFSSLPKFQLIGASRRARHYPTPNVLWCHGFVDCEKKSFLTPVVTYTMTPCSCTLKCVCVCVCVRAPNSHPLAATGWPMLMAALLYAPPPPTSKAEPSCVRVTECACWRGSACLYVCLCLHALQNGTCTQ